MDRMPGKVYTLLSSAKSIVFSNCSFCKPPHQHLIKDTANCYMNAQYDSIYYLVSLQGAVDAKGEGETGSGS